MDTLTFDVIATAWKKLISDQDKVSVMQMQAPTFINPSAIKIKNVSDDGDTIHINFYGFEVASSDTQGVPTVKRMILNWVKKFSDQVQVIDSVSTDLNLVVSKYTKFTEAAVPVFRRDPKTNKVKRAYKCIGGSKNGKRVSDPNQCMQYPSVDKKIKLSVSKRAKYGQSAKARTKTRLTNIVAKRTRKANQRLKKARGF